MNSGGSETLEQEELSLIQPPEANRYPKVKMMSLADEGELVRQTQRTRNFWSMPSGEG